MILDFVACTHNHLAMNNASSNEKLNTENTLTPDIDAIWLSISDSLICFWQWMHLTFVFSK